MLTFSNGTSLEIISDKLFLCNKVQGTWIELSVQGGAYLSLYLKGTAPVNDEGERLIEYLYKQGYLTESNNIVEIPEYSSMVQITIDTSEHYKAQITTLFKLKDLQNHIQLALKYNRRCQIEKYLERISPDILVVHENDLSEFIQNFKNVKFEINIVIFCEYISVESLAEKVKQLYSTGISSISIYYNINHNNYTKIDSYIYLASEMMLGFNWNIEWCKANYPPNIIYNVLRKALYTYGDVNFDIYPSSPIYMFNIFQPCYKCNFPINRLVINKNGSISPCIYFTTEHINIDSIEYEIHNLLKTECSDINTIDEHMCNDCEILTFCPYKDPLLCCSNCRSIKFMQLYRLTIFSVKESIENNIKLLDEYYKKFYSNIQ